MPVNEYVKDISLVNRLANIRSNKLVQVLFFALLTAAAAQISVPVKPVPFTLQTIMVVLAGAFLGAKKGAYSQVLYLSLGIIGLPVFAQTADPTFGFARLMGPTGGYLLSFPIAAFITGLIIEKYKSYFSITAAMFLGNAIVILSGVLFLNTFYIQDINQAIAAGAVIFSLWTVIKVIISASVYSALRKK